MIRFKTNLTFLFFFFFFGYVSPDMDIQYFYAFQTVWSQSYCRTELLYGGKHNTVIENSVHFT